MGNHKHEVNWEYCKYCKYSKKTEQDDPCWDCLNEPVNDDSRRPLYYQEKDPRKNTLL